MTGPDHPRLLPSTLIEEHTADPGSPRRVRRTVRDWLVDLGLFLLAGVIALVVATDPSPAPSPWVVRADLLAGVLGCAALWLRRRWPVGVALALTPLAVFSDLVGGAVLITQFTVVVHRPFRVAAPVCGLGLATVPLYGLVRADPDLPFPLLALLGVVLTVTVLGWGMFVRARRQLVLSLRERARRAESEARLRAEQAQRRAREQIAREMHDVLAHRLSLLSVHAGALEYHPDASPEDVSRAAGVIRHSAHQALQDLRDVIGVLRAPVGEDADPGGQPAGPDGERPQPALSHLADLVAESRRAGTAVTLDDRLEDPEAVPATVGRTAYRIVQEGLTNVRKHAPGGEVTVTVEGDPGRGLTVEVRNPLPAAGCAPSDIPGAGQGLLGLTERATLVGGRLEHGRTSRGDFRLHAWLPWPA
ncbi:histidine kinase [Wenjunlia vitaminophila]|uniref:histidine kinase n=1 Tax=Wenjunlia vitaminophila TaxID=76728 RepID=A0A0T6LYC4_WENVI|nr:histidine kinase [Wenjunlia vitaminophila]